MSKKEIVIYPDKPPSINQIVKELKTLPVLSLEAIDLIKEIEKGDEESINELLVYLLEFQNNSYNQVSIELSKYLINSENSYWTIPDLMIQIAVIYGDMDNIEKEFYWYKKSLNYLLEKTPNNQWNKSKNTFKVIYERLEYFE